MAEWRLLVIDPKLASVAVYLHLVAFSAVLLSGFWSLTNEVLDAHTAKQRDVMGITSIQDYTNFTPGLEYNAQNDRSQAVETLRAQSNSHFG